MGSSQHFLKNSSSKANPIAVGEFANALAKIWRPHDTYRDFGGGHDLGGFGLAISGGVDSMALGILCSQLQSKSSKSLVDLTSSQEAHPSPLHLLRKLEFRAFVVDHGVRSGSNSEAHSVARILGQKGIPTQVLKIDWSNHQNPANLPNFESLARRYRFQALGKACRDHGIKSLLLAHHQDDQAETVLMRMINGHRSTGLVGIKADGGIPECYGMYGIHESGGYDLSAPRERPELREQLPIENGGIRVYRPLLTLPKDRLISTCQAEEMEWFEDPTNKNRTLTTRNAIRHMYKSHITPAALSKPALIALSARCKTTAASQLQLAESHLSQCTIKNFQTQTGMVETEFTTLDSTTIPKPTTTLIMSHILRHIIMLVTPEEHVSTSSLQKSAKRIFPELYPDETAPFPTTFTVAGLQFKPIPTKTHPIKTKTWQISRQIHPSQSQIPTILILPSNSKSPSPLFSNWELWDGRYWLRIRNKSHKQSILVRPFHKEDLKGFKHALDWKSKRKLSERFKYLAPGDIRFTIPCIVLREENGREMVMALPSLGISARNREAVVDWEVRYKKVYAGPLSLDGALL